MKTPRKIAGSLRKALTVGLFGVFAFMLTFGTLLGAPRPVHAQAVVSDPGQTAVHTYNQVKSTITDLLVQGTVVALANSVNYFASQLAYELAVMIVDGCPGQKSCWNADSLTGALANAGLGAMGEFVGSMNEAGFKELGLDLCAPSADFGLRIQLGMLQEKKPPPPKCDINQVAKNWKDAVGSMTPDQIAKTAWQGFQPGTAPVSMAFSINSKLKWDIISGAESKAQYERLLAYAGGGGFGDIKDPVTGKVLTPAGVVFEEYKQGMAKRNNADMANQMYVAGQIARGAVWGAILSNATSTFAQTLIARLWNKVVKGLLSPEEANRMAQDVVLSAEGVVHPGEEEVRGAIESRFDAPKLQEVGEIDPLALFSICPDDNRTVDNCIVDSMLANAVRLAGAKPVTVRDAIEKNMLHGEWPLVSSLDVARNTSKDCYTSAYCESNLKKLRAARILPAGWEIAAHKSPAARPWKLKDVVAGFNDCDDSGNWSAAHPYCHLIDPDWVLKQPPTKCMAQGYTSTLISSSSSTRAQVCVDKVSCLAEDDFGNCLGGYGYCTRERNVWRMNGDICPAEYNSCRVYTSRSGGQIALLANTVDHGACTASNVGCGAYATRQNAFECRLTANQGGADGSGTCSLAGGCACKIQQSCSVATGFRRCLLTNGESCTLLQEFCVAGPCSCSRDYSCLVGKDQKTCRVVSGDASNKGDDWLVTPALYLNAQAKSCPASDGGCTALYRMEIGQSLNLIRNGGFEELEDADGDGSTDHAKYWAPYGNVPAGGRGSISTDGTRSTSGSNAARAGAYSNSAASNVCNGSCDSEAGCPCRDGDYSCRLAKGETRCRTSNMLYQDGISIRSGATYTLSLKARAETDVTSSTVSIQFRNKRGETAVALDISASPANYCVGQGGSAMVADVVPAEDRKSGYVYCTFSAVGDVGSARLVIADSGDTYFDEIMLEEGGGTNGYHDGYSAGVETVYAKVPPPELGCTGGANDRAECQDYAAVCRDNEVGCDSYSPLTGEPSIPAVAGPQDACPAECSGYDIFKQSATDFDQEKFPTYFIPSTARQCTASEVGCSQFTNVKTEAVEYYARLRLCQAPTAADNQVFYSWEGSDTTGYQLKVWNLKRTAGKVTDKSADGDLADDICANRDHDSCDSAKPIGAAESSATNDGTRAGTAPCTRVVYDASGNMVCDDAASAEFGICSRKDIAAGDFDCRELYDEFGNRHFRQLSRTVLATDTCFRFRITASTESDCLFSNGQWDSAKQECHYDASATESLTCSSASNGCRAYRGNAATNVRTLFTDTFESGLGDWVDGNNAVAGVSQSSESVNVGGHSLKVVPDNTADRYVQAIVSPERTYTVEFWAKGSGGLEVKFDQGGSASCVLPDACGQDEGCFCNDGKIACWVLKDSNSCAPSGTGDLTCTSSMCNKAGGCPCYEPTKNIYRCLIRQNNSSCTVPDPFSAPDNRYGGGLPQINLTAEWRHYSLGPVSSGLAAWTNYPVRLQFRQLGGSGDSYLDNITLKEIQDSIYVVRDSWKTPTSCDQTLDGTPSPLEMVGCRAYVNSAAETKYLRSFSQLCRESSVGCRAYANLQGTTDYPFDRSYNAVCRLPDVCSASSGSIFTGANCTCSYDFPASSAESTKPTLYDVCRVAIGEKECRFNLDGQDSYQSRAEHPDIAYVPADERVYLVVNQDNVCPATSAGCRELGKSDLAYDGQCSYATCANNTDLVCGRDADCGAGGWCTKRATQCVGGPRSGDVCNTNAYCQPANGGYCLEVGTQKQCNSTTGLCDCRDSQSGAFRCKVEKGQSSCTYAARDGSPSSWGKVTLLDNPDQYAEQLCLEPEIGCEQFQTKAGSAYFKDPGNKKCVYKERVTYQGKERSGWFRQTASGLLPCYGELLKDGDFYAMYKNDDSHCALSQLCPNDAGCYCYPPGMDATNAAPVCKVLRGDRTCGYEGWAGVCEARYDSCEEFVDPVASSSNHPAGQPYYYIVNSKLDMTSCNGQANLKNGCVVFKKTSDTQNLFSASASYQKSIAESGGSAVSVTPVNCNVPNRSPLCEKRCFVYKDGLCASSFSNIHADKPCAQDSDCSVAGERCLGAESYSNGCLVDGDCKGASEKCLAYDETTVADWFDAKDTYGLPGVHRTNNDFTRNDTNLVIKVRPDRECAEWLACREAETVWDEQQNKWTSSCTDFGVCQDNVKAGESLECTKWVEPPRTRLTETVYASRDVTWKGYEFAGFSVVGSYHPQLLTPVAIGDAVCVGGTDDGKACDNGCPAGVCSTSSLANQRYGVAFGKCSNNANKLCRDDGDCPDGSCDLGCDPDDVNACLTDGVGKGTCLNRHCYYAFSGGPLEVANQSTKASCRAYPVGDAPYNFTVLDGGNNGYDGYGNAMNRTSAFAGANVCVKGNDCDCIFTRYGYGRGGSIARFHATDAGSGTEANQIWSGICSGGENDAAPCSLNSDCPQGMCSKITSRSTAIGWPGFCLDRDESLAVNNDPKDFACVNWLPVQALSGMPDQYNQYAEAGYQNDKDLLYCQDANGYRSVGNGSEYTRTAVSQATIFDSDCDTNTQLFSSDFYHTDADCYDDNGGGGRWYRKYTDTATYKDQLAGMKVYVEHGDGGYTDSSFTFYLVPFKNTDGTLNDNRWVNVIDAGKGNIGNFPTGNQGVVQSGECYTRLTTFSKCSDNHGCIGIEADFDQTTSALDHFMIAMCTNEEEGASHRGRMTVTFYYRETCNEIAWVSRISGQGNVAWTDRLWKSGQYSASGYAYDWTSELGNDGANTDMTPFGMISLAPEVGPNDSAVKFSAGSGNIPPALWNRLPPIYSSEGGSGYTFFYPNSDGSELVQDWGTAIMGRPYACSGNCGGATPSAWQNKGSNVSKAGADNLSQLFAVAWRIYGMNRDARQYDAQAAALGYAAWDKRETFATNGNRPVIVSVDTAQCTGDNSCVEGGEGLTVNGLMGGDVESNVGAGRLRVNLKYYAYADKDHLPILRKAVDYGDGSPTRYLEGQYKNHRGVVKNGDKFDPICSSDATEWGKQPDACDGRYFEEMKTYICNRQLLASLSACSNPGSPDETYPCQESGACVFRPRVQVMDNWGYCNGVCAGGTGGLNDACVNYNLTAPIWDPVNGFFGSGAGNNRAGKVMDECLSSQTNFRDVDEFNKGNQYKAIRPWTWANSRIKVYPAE
ncbi:MAG: hypothetical protein PHT12_04215 [Patescibacteria group bacterium]|nr:hypothetical protein [Patescibacteria group bacterium]